MRILLIKYLHSYNCHPSTKTFKLYKAQKGPRIRHNIKTCHHDFDELGTRVLPTTSAAYDSNAGESEKVAGINTKQPSLFCSPIKAKHDLNQNINLQISLVARNPKNPAKHR